MTGPGDDPTAWQRVDLDPEEVDRIVADVEKAALAECGPVEMMAAASKRRI